MVMQMLWCDIHSMCITPAVLHPVSCLLQDYMHGVDVLLYTCLQAQWKPGHLHWEGIDQMLMQGASASALEALTASPTDSEGNLESWLAATAEQSQQRLHPMCQLTQQTPALVMSQAEGLSDPAVVGNDGVDVSPTHASQASSATDLLPGPLWDSSADSDHWFDRLDLAAARKSSAGTGIEAQSYHTGRRAHLWGPPPPPQYPAMLRGELALAVMTGVAGKSLLKEVQSSSDYLPDLDVSMAQFITWIVFGYAICQMHSQLSLWSSGVPNVVANGMTMYDWQTM